MSRWYASYVTLDMQIIYLFAIWLVPSIVQLSYNVYFKDVRFIGGPHLAIIGPSEARAD